MCQAAHVRLAGSGASGSRLCKGSRVTGGPSSRILGVTSPSTWRLSRKPCGLHRSYRMFIYNAQNGFKIIMALYGIVAIPLEGYDLRLWQHEASCFCAHHLYFRYIFGTVWVRCFSALGGEVWLCMRSTWAFARRSHLGFGARLFISDVSGPHGCGTKWLSQWLFSSPSGGESPQQTCQALQTAVAALTGAPT